MTLRDGGRAWIVDIQTLAPTDALVMKVYRSIMAGFSVGQTDCWDVGWQALGEFAAPAEAGPLFGEFYGFVRALLAVAPAALSWRPASCRGLCNDELLALGMIGAAQRSDMVGLLGAAAKLLAVDELGDARRSTQSLAAALAPRGLLLSTTRQDEACRFDLCPLRQLH